MKAPNDLDRAYAAFFDKNEGGQYMFAWITEQIESEHQKAESNPELSRDHTQRAKGFREVLEHITSVKGGLSGRQR